MTSAASQPDIGTPGFCDSCPYWQSGQCRRNPPSAGLGFAKVWPNTHAGDWCGEHPDRAPRSFAERERDLDVVLDGCADCGVAFDRHKPSCPTIRKLSIVPTAAKRAKRGPRARK